MAGISDEFYFFAKPRQFHGVKSVLPFSKLIIGKSQVFSTRSYVYLPGYTQICDRGDTLWPPSGYLGLIVDVDQKTFGLVILSRLINRFCLEFQIPRNAY